MLSRLSVVCIFDHYHETRVRQIVIYVSYSWRKLEVFMYFLLSPYAEVPFSSEGQDFAPKIISITHLNKFYFNRICPQKLLPLYIGTRHWPGVSYASLVPRHPSPIPPHLPCCTTPSPHSCVIDAFFTINSAQPEFTLKYYTFKIYEWLWCNSGS